jgi:predicted GTPase
MCCNFQGLAQLKKKITKLGVKNRSPGHLHHAPRILFIGETGSGKSSFISSIVSSLKGEIVYISDVGEKEGDEVNTSKRVRQW